MTIVSTKFAGDFYISVYSGYFLLLVGGPKAYWGSNAAEKEGKGA